MADARFKYTLIQITSKVQPPKRCTLIPPRGNEKEAKHTCLEVKTCLKRSKEESNSILNSGAPALANRPPNFKSCVCHCL